MWVIGDIIQATGQGDPVGSSSFIRSTCIEEFQPHLMTACLFVEEASGVWNGCGLGNGEQGISHMETD